MQTTLLRVRAELLSVDLILVLVLLLLEPDEEPSDSEEDVAALAVEGVAE